MHFTNEATQIVSLRPQGKEREDFDFWASVRGKIKTFLIGKELKTKDLRQTAAERGKNGTTKPNPKPRTASAKSVFTHFVEPENVARGENDRVHLFVSFLRADHARVAT